MTTDELIELIAEALEVNPADIVPETTIASIPEWNSLVWLTIMSLLDERYALQLEPRKIRSFVTVEELIEHIRSRAMVIS